MLISPTIPYSGLHDVAGMQHSLKDLILGNHIGSGILLNMLVSGERAVINESVTER